MSDQEAPWEDSASIRPWAIGAIVVTALYFGRGVFIPITLAIFLSFLLAPIVALFHWVKLPRAPAVLLAVMLALGATAATGTILGSQAATLAVDAPAYAQRINEKATNIRASLRQRFGFLMQESREGGSGDRRTQNARIQGTAALRAPPATHAVPVEVHQPPSTAIEGIEGIVLPVLSPIETILIVLVVAIFILLQKEDLRDRLIRLMGAGDLHRTTSALDEGAKRLSRYFLAQFAVNCAFGAVIWGGLFLIGVPSPGLWGIVAGFLRFVPYVGTIIAALAPLTLAAAVDRGWGMTISVAALFAFVEPFVGYVIEPFLYGRSTGLAPVSVVVAAVFWTTLWGPVGLILSMPLTLSLVVLGRHLPAFALFDILLGDRPALSPTETFYQRVLAGHGDEAPDQAEDLLDEMPVADYFDEVALGGLRLAAYDVDRRAVSRGAMAIVCEMTIGVVTSLAHHRDVAAVDLPRPLDPDPARQPITGRSNVSAQLARPRVACIAARGPLDRAVCAMLVQMLERQGVPLRQLEREEQGAGQLHNLILADIDVLCIVGLFDERAFRRINAVREQLASNWPTVTFLIGVRRSILGDGDLARGEYAADLLPSLKELGVAASQTAQAHKPAALNVGI